MMEPGSMPDVTPAQAVAVVGWIVAQLVSYGVVDSETSKVILSITATVVAVGWKLADAWVRNGRNKARAAAIAAGKPDPAKKQ